MKQKQWIKAQQLLALDLKFSKDSPGLIQIHVMQVALRRIYLKFWDHL